MVPATDRQVLRTQYKHDVPRAFIYTNARQESIICGSYAQAISTFASKNNFELQYEYTDQFTIQEMYQGLQNKHYNISWHGIAATRHVAAVTFSYPVEWMQNCIMVPLEDEIPKYLYVIWPFGRYIWLTGFIGAIYIAILMRYIDYRRRSVTHSIMRNILHSIAILLYCSNMNLRLKNAATRVLIFYSLLLMLGFILSAYYAPYLTAYNMKPVFTEPINTVQDLLEANIKVLIPLDELQELSANDNVDLSPLMPLIRPVSRDEFSKHLEGLNRSFAYIIAQDQWNYIHKQQRILLKPYFHFSNVCFGAVFNAFPIQAKSTFAKLLNSYILSLQQAGLWKFWEEQAFNVAVIAGYTQVLLDTYPVEPLDLAWFRLAWLVLAIGIPASLFAFFAEFFMKKYQHWNNNYYQFY